MTARGELFVDEDIRDFVGIKEFDKKFGEDWTIDASEFSGTWDEANLPSNIKAPIKDSHHKVVGYLEAKLKFNVEGYDFDKYIEPEIVTAKIKKVR